MQNDRGFWRDDEEDQEPGFYRGFRADTEEDPGFSRDPDSFDPIPSTLDLALKQAEEAPDRPAPSLDEPYSLADQAQAQADQQREQRETLPVFQNQEGTFGLPGPETDPANRTGEPGTPPARVEPSTATSAPTGVAADVPATAAPTVGVASPARPSAPTPVKPRPPDPYASVGLGQDDWVPVASKDTGSVQWIQRRAFDRLKHQVVDPRNPGLPPKPPVVTAPQGSETSTRPPDRPVGAGPVDLIVQKSTGATHLTPSVTKGISQLMHGDQAGAWTEPYLNDVGRLAWAKEEAAQGRTSDPKDAPVDYIETWKDAFFGSDPSVPLVREMDQQMLDYGSQQTHPGGPFNWKAAFGPDGSNGLISRQVASNDCGPNAFSVVLRSKGYNIDPAQAFQYAKTTGYHDGEQFTGPNSMARMLTKEAGIQATAAPLDWTEVNRQLDSGNVVLLSSGGHYWALSSKREGPHGTEYYAGATASVVSNPEWGTAGAFRYGGAPNTMIVQSGQADPNAPAMKALGLKAPASQIQATPSRALLSQLTTGVRAGVPTEQLMTKLYGSPSFKADARRLSDTTSRKSYDTGPDTDWYSVGADLAGEEGVDPQLVQAVMEQESGGKVKAQSGKGAAGLMQLMPETAAEMGVDLRDPTDNVRGGVRYLKRMLDRYGDVETALAAYNAGPGAVDRYGGIPPYGETQKYVPQVLERYRRRVAAAGNRAVRGSVDER